MLYFVTGNSDKFYHAKDLLTPFGISLIQKNIPLIEIQSDSTEEIVLHKATQAFEVLSSPLLTTDHAWYIPGLNGFPGPYMKYMNQWLTAENFLDLTKSLKDRRVIFEEVICYKDQSGYKIFTEKHSGTLLKEIKGDRNPYPAMTICSFIPGLSVAEAIQNKQHLFDNKSIWKNIFKYLKDKNFIKLNST